MLKDIVFCLKTRNKAYNKINQIYKNRDLIIYDFINTYNNIEDETERTIFMVDYVRNEHILKIDKNIVLQHLLKWFVDNTANGVNDIKTILFLTKNVKYNDTITKLRDILTNHLK